MLQYSFLGNEIKTVHSTPVATSPTLHNCDKTFLFLNYAIKANMRFFLRTPRTAEALQDLSVLQPFAVPFDLDNNAFRFFLLQCIYYFPHSTLHLTRFPSICTQFQSQHYILFCPLPFITNGLPSGPLIISLA